MPVRVLIVDDQEPFRLAARMVVEATDGFDVVGEAETGEDVVSHGRRARPRPGADGRQPAGHQRARGDAADPGESDDRSSCSCSPPTRKRSTRREAAECGAAAYIPKAVFGPDRLEDAWAAATEPPERAAVSDEHWSTCAHRATA